MPKSALGEMATNEVLKKRLAKLMALECFRNSKLEDLHAGIYPDSQSGDYSDVKVVSPYGEISWERLGRFSDDEMKLLMIDVVDRCYEFLSRLLEQQSAGALLERLRLRDPLPSSTPALWPTPLNETFGTVAVGVIWLGCRQRGRTFLGAQEPVV